jgi:hypothetical protein
MDLYRRVLRAFVVATVVALLAACSADLSDYQDSGPRFDLFEYFEGDTQAWGMIQERSGKQTRRFEVKLVGTVDGDTLTLVEDFVFDDGEEDQRIWVITKQSDGRYTGRADDIIGQATGEEQGNALRWSYDFELPYKDSTIKVYFDDWLYRQDDEHVFNLTSIRKFGFEVATLTLFFKKTP